MFEKFLPAVASTLTDRILKACGKVVDDVVRLGKKMMREREAGQEDRGRVAMWPTMKTFLIKGGCKCEVFCTQELITQ